MELGFIEITSQKELDTLLIEKIVFHDSILKEMQLPNRAYIREDNATEMNYLFDAFIHFQSPWKPFSCLLLFIGVDKLSLNDPTE